MRVDPPLLRIWKVREGSRLRIIAYSRPALEELEASPLQAPASAGSKARASGRLECVRDVEFRPVHSLLETEAAAAGIGRGLIVGIEDAIAQARRNGLAPLVPDRPIALRRRAPVVAADIPREIDEPFVVDTMACFHSDDLVSPLFPLRCEPGITGKGHLQLERAIHVEIARAEGCVDAPIGICSRDSHASVGRGERLVEGHAGVRAESALTPFEEAQADPEEA